MNPSTGPTLWMAPVLSVGPTRLTPMSKVDAMRAMREAKYARGGKVPDPPGAPAPKAATPAVRTKPVSSSAPVADEQVDTDALCGHRNMGGKSCSRPAGHSEKNHRYASA